MLVDFLVVIALTVANGVLAMSELSVVSAKPARLRAMVAKGNTGAAQALRLAADPGRFLSTVQIGITLVGILAGAYSGARIGTRLAVLFEQAGIPPAVADPLGVGVAVVAITYLSLILGELVPKRIALRNPEAMAAMVAPYMVVLSRIAAPLVWLLDVSGRLVLAFLGQSGARDHAVSDEEIRIVLAEAHAAGVIEDEETEMMAGVMRLADRAARGLMTPRHEVQTVSAGATLRTVLARFAASGHSRLPVEDPLTGSITGVLFASDFIAAAGGARPVPARLMRQVPVVSDRADALDVLKLLRDGREHMVLVYDEFGHFEGIITAGNILSAITGGFVAENQNEPAILEREGGKGWLVAGWMPADEFRDTLGLALPEGGDFETVAGLLLMLLESVPNTGDTVTMGDWHFEVVDMDGRRIDKVLVTHLSNS